MINESEFSIDRKEIFQKLFDDYYGTLVCYAQKYVGREDVAEDLVQDLFILLWEQQRTFTTIAAFRSFLYISIRNSALNYLKHQDVENQYVAEVLNTSRVLPEDSFQEEEIYRLLFKLIDGLPGRCREIFLLHLEGYSNESIAVKLTLSVETVKTQKKRAMKILRDNLNDNSSEKHSKYLFFLIFMYLDLYI